MRLAAIYINKHDFLFDEPQTINFGGEYIYSFNSDNGALILERKKNPDYIDGFWGTNISLVSAIVGANGSGKTNLSVEIFNNLSSVINDYKKNINDVYCLFIFEDNGKTILKFKLYYMSEDRVNADAFEIPKDIRNRRSELKYKEISFERDLVEIDLDNMSNDRSFVMPYYFNLTYPFHQKIKISYQIEAAQSIPFLSDDKLISKLEETFNEINFIKNFKIETNDSAFNFKSLDIYIHNNVDPFKAFSQVELEELLKTNYIINDKYYFFKYLDDIFTYENRETGIYDLNGEIFQNRKKIEDSLFDYNCQLIARVFFKVASENYLLYQNLSRVVISKINYNTLKTKEEFLKVLNLIFPFLRDERKLYEFVEKIKLLVELTPADLILVLNRENLKNNNEFIRAYIDVVNNVKLQCVVPTNFNDDYDYINTNFLIFKPGNNISDGERNLIKIFSAIHNNKNDISNLLILDEPELGFHPLWKKKFIKAITSLIPIILNKKGSDSIQIIFTTHDPLTLSDLPNNNIVYLNKVNGKSIVLKEDERPQKSFGANITDLLADSFFIKDGLIGDFAKKKIEITLNWLKIKANGLNIQNEGKDNYYLIDSEIEVLEFETLDEEYDYHKKIIELIDEPLVKNKLRSMFIDYIPEKTFFLDEEIKKAEERLQSLKRRRDA